jgi:hypothetical protein
MSRAADDQRAAKALLIEHLCAALALADEYDIRAAAHIAMAIDAVTAHQDADTQSSER